MTTARIEVTVNDRDNRTFDIEGSPAVRQIVVHDDIRSLSFKVLSGAAETIGYGAIFESAPGVVVDNYSIRSNNGQAMFWTSPTVNAQINEMLGYDLVILQYGLNILEPGIRSFAKYGEPDREDDRLHPAVLPYGRRISDERQRPQREVGLGIRPDGFGPLHGCGPTAGRAEQRGSLLERLRRHAVTRRHGAIRGQRLAGKDYTHINFAGGRRVAWALYDAINRGAEQHPPFTPVAYDNVIDTRKISHLEMMLRQAARPRMQKP